MDIFDDDEQVEVVARPSTSTSVNSDASSGSGRPLFLPDDDDDDVQLINHNQQQQNEVNDIFNSVLGADDLDLDFTPLASGEQDYDSLEREAQQKARTKIPRHQILSSSPPPPDFGNDASSKEKGKGKDDAPKEKRKPMRLDEARLVGPTGFPQLIQDTKDFRIKGKGHEATDLNRLLQIYQYWTHRMYPKSQFKDTVDRVEKLCHSKLMHNKLSMWRDEAHGKTHSDKEQDDEAGQEEGTEAVGANPDESVNTRASSVQAMSDAAAYASSSPTPTRPPSSAPSNAGNEFDDQDMEDLWNEMELEKQELEKARSAPSQSTSGKTAVDSMDVDDDIEAWLALEETMDNQSMTTSTTASTGVSPTTTSTSSKNVDNSFSVVLDNDDEDMWEISREMERKEATAKVNQVTSTSDLEPKTSTVSTTNDDYDDMYR